MHLVCLLCAVTRRCCAPRVQVARSTAATGTTNAACALRPYVDRRQRVDWFVIVTDEQENGTSRGSNFAQLFQQYRAEVHAGAEVFFARYLARARARAAAALVSRCRRGCDADRTPAAGIPVFSFLPPSVTIGPMGVRGVPRSPARPPPGYPAYPACRCLLLPPCLGLTVSWESAVSNERSHRRRCPWRGLASAPRCSSWTGGARI